MSEAFDKGSVLFKTEPDLLLAAVWHVAAKQFPKREDQIEFVNGYSAARRRFDAYGKEKGDEQHSAGESDPDKTA